MIKYKQEKKKTDFVFCQVDLGFFLVCLGFLEIRIVIHFGGYEDSVFAFFKCRPFLTSNAYINSSGII